MRARGKKRVGEKPQYVERGKIELGPAVDDEKR